MRHLVALSTAALLASCAGAPTFRHAAFPAPTHADARRPRLVVQSGHDKRIVAAAFSDDGHTLATGGEDGQIIVWDVARGVSVAELRLGALSDVALSPDGKLLAATDGSQTMLFDIATSSPTASIEGKASSLSFSPDGKALALRGDHLTLFDITRAAVVHQRKAPSGYSVNRKAAFHPTRPLLAYVDDDGAKVIDTGTFAVVSRIDANAERGDIARDVALFEGQVAVLRDGAVAIHTIEGGAPKANLEKPPSARSFERMAVGASGRLFAASVDQLVVFDLASGKASSTTSIPPTDEVSARVAVSTLGVAARLSDTDITLASQLGAHPLSKPSTVREHAWSSDGKRLLTLETGGTLRSWDMRTGRLQSTLTGLKRWDDGIAISADGALAAVPHDSEITLYDGALSAKKRALGKVDGNLYAMTFSADGKRLAAATFSKVYLWDTTTGGPLGPLDDVCGKPNCNIRSLSFTPDGTRLLVGGAAGAAAWVDAASGAVSRLDALASANVSLSRDGATIAVAGNRVELLDARTLARKHELTIEPRGERGAYPSSVSFSEDGKRIAVSSLVVRTLGRKVSVFDVGSSTPSVEFEGSYATFGPLPDLLVSHQGGLRMRRLGEARWVSLQAFETPSGPAQLAYADSGEFDGDDATFDRVFYRVGPELVSADQLFERYHHPNLLAELFSAKPAPAAPAPVELGPSPHVDLVGLPRETRDERIKVSLKVSDRGGGVGEVRLFVNGKRADQGRGLELDTRAESKTYEVELGPGDNEIVAEAYSAKGKVRSDRAVAHVQRVAQGVDKPDLHLLAFTLDEYEDPSLKLSYANADGDAVVKAFEAQQGRLYRKVQVSRLRDRDATREAFADRVSQIARAAHAADVFVLYAAGHGTMLACNGAEQPRYQLLTHRATLRKDTSICQASIADSELADVVRKVPAHKKLLVLDTCQAGGMATGELLAAATRGAEEIDTIKRLARAEGVAIIAAAKPTQYAGEVPKLGHGIFSYHYC